MIEILAQVKAPKPRQFVAGRVLWDDIVVEAAPIIGYMKRGRWTRARVREYCKAQGWHVEVIHEVRSNNGPEAAARSRA